MYDKLIVLSDIHANLTALEAVIEDISKRNYIPDAVISLGDIIDYGMRPNETISIIKQLPWPLPVNLCGNHENAVLNGDLSRFSTDRGRRMLEYTSASLSAASRAFITGDMNRNGFETRKWCGKNILFVHGSLQDTYWGTIKSDNVSESIYKDYDFVLSGHSHIPHHIEHFSVVDNPVMRNKKRTAFINPGAVGQPRNHNPQAQYVYMELTTNTIHFNSVQYDIEAEQALYPDCLDVFYKERLTFGI